MPLKMTDIKTCIKCSESKHIDLFEKNRNVCRICRLKQTQNARNARKVTNITVVTKECVNCNQIKDASEFNKLSNSQDGLDKYCRKCYKVVRNPNRKIVTSTANITLLHCIKCNSSKPSTMFRTTKKSNTGYFKICMDCWKPSVVTKERQKEYEARYKSKYPEKLKAKYKKQGQRLQKRIKDRLRARITSALSSINYKKSDKTIEYLGCSISYLKKWLEFQFTEGITWENYNEWHIDHVTPCESFDLSNKDEQTNCFNWSNLRPCLIRENLSKGAKIITSLIEKQKQLASEFLKINPLPSQPGDRVDGTE